jgi:hypothetical protein
MSQHISHKKAVTFIESSQRDLNFIFSKIAVLDELNRKITAYLEPHIAKYCQIGNIINHKLVLITANSSIATQIRFQANDLVQKLHQDPVFHSIKRIECIVRPSTSATRFTAAKKNNMIPLSKETAQIVHEMAQSIEDASLRETMERIARRVKE